MALVPQSLKACLGFLRLSISNLGRLQQSTLAHPPKPNLSAAVAVQGLLQTPKRDFAAASITSTLKPVFNSVVASPATGTIPALSSSAATGLCQGASSSGLLYSSIRSIMRIHFPRPRERKRLANHGYQARMKTASQRRIIMRRILKGRHSLWHA